MFFFIFSITDKMQALPMPEMQALPCSPFRLDTRARNEETTIDFLSNWLECNGLQKYKVWLNRLTYMQLFSTESEIWDAIERIVEEDAVAPYPAGRRTASDAGRRSGSDEDLPDQPTRERKGLENKFTTMIERIQNRRFQLIEYHREIESNMQGNSFIRVAKLDEILTYLLNIVNYPMDEYVDDQNVAGMILIIVSLNIQSVRINFFRIFSPIAYSCETEKYFIQILWEARDKFHH